jgi:hypothetical protein
LIGNSCDGAATRVTVQKVAKMTAPENDYSLNYPYIHFKAKGVETVVEGI